MRTIILVSMLVGFVCTSALAQTPAPQAAALTELQPGQIGFFDLVKGQTFGTHSISGDEESGQAYQIVQTGPNDYEIRLFDRFILGGDASVGPPWAHKIHLDRPGGGNGSFQLTAEGNRMTMPVFVTTDSFFEGSLTEQGRHFRAAPNGDFWIISGMVVTALHRGQLWALPPGAAEIAAAQTWKPTPVIRNAQELPAEKPKKPGVQQPPAETEASMVKLKF